MIPRRRRRAFRTLRATRPAAASPRYCGAGRDAAASGARPGKSVGPAARRFDDDANAGLRVAPRGRDSGAVAERSDAGAKARLGGAHRPAGDDDRAAVVAVGWPPDAPRRPIDRSIAPGSLRSPRRRLMGSPPIFRADRQSCLASRQSCAPKGQGVSSSCCSPTMRFLRRPRRKPRGCRIAPACVYSIGWSNSASCANCRGGPVFGSTAYRDQQ